MRFFIGFLCLCSAAFCEVRTITLREAVDLALKQNPDMTLARLDEQRAVYSARLAADPFTPKVYVGSGLAYSSGFPMSLEGSSPSILQARASMSIFNRPLSYQVAAARENARSAAIDTQAKREDVALRTATLYLDAQRAARNLDLARRQVENLERVAETVKARVAEGRDLPIEVKRVTVNLARARQRVKVLEGEQEYAGRSLAAVLGFSAEDRIATVTEEQTPLEMPESEEVLVEEALRNSRELRRLESQVLAKGLELKGYEASRLPTVDLVAQYALLGRFNNYEDFFNRFQRNNGQLGVAVRLPILPGGGASAQRGQAEVDLAKLKAQIASTRNRIILDARRSYQDLMEAQAAREVAKMDLDLAREQLSVLLALMEEGRATTRQIEEARFLENERWIEYYNALHTLEQAKLNLLRQRGDLLAALR
jgi:Outer membrane protein